MSQVYVTALTVTVENTPRGQQAPDEEERGEVTFLVSRFPEAMPGDPASQQLALTGREPGGLQDERLSTRRVQDSHAETAARRLPPFHTRLQTSCRNTAHDSARTTEPRERSRKMDPG
ncbi:hypothetical protein TREES_T100009714 [Tupaia chinensis]|uniref:Uncharacterized protein n=1 Tax=Tupaia chinensis TaxID=246437 RepID=L9L302_TUPCH|nr:hypothetical protein TREES_T100009714 [Tupaia chinensis]